MIQLNTELLHFTISNLESLESLWLLLIAPVGDLVLELEGSETDQIAIETQEIKIKSIEYKVYYDVVYTLKYNIYTFSDQNYINTLIKY